MRKAASQVGIAPTLLISTGMFIVSSLVITSTVFAWSTQEKAEAYCESNSIKVKATFKNTEPNNSGMGMIVVAKDEQTGKSVNIGTVAPGQSKDGVIDTGLNQVSNGRVKFNLSWSNGNSGTDVRYANYSGTACPQPTATPTVAPTATPAPTVAPTATPVPTVAPTVTPSPTGTPVPTQVPVVTPAPTEPPVVRTDLTDGRSDGRRESLDCVPESQNGRKQCNDTPTAVAGVSTELPSTGAKEAMQGVMTLFAIALGVYAKKFASVKEQTLATKLDNERSITYVNLQ